MRIFGFTITRTPKPRPGPPPRPVPSRFENESAREFAKRQERFIQDLERYKF